MFAKSINKEGSHLVEDARRNRHMLPFVNEVHKLAWSADNWDSCQEAFRVMKEGDADEMEQYITRCRFRQRKED